MKKSFALLLLTSPLLAAEDDGCISSCDCCPIDHSAYLELSHREPGGIGYGIGYTSLDLFYGFNARGNNYAYFDLRGHIFNDGKWASNVGLGLRHLAEYSDVVTGLNFFWDWRDAKHGSYHQLGIGFEALWPYLDFHFNGYIPVGRERERSRFGFRKFEGNRALIEKKYTLNMGGFDTGIGYWICKGPCFGLHASLGGYYFRGNFNHDFGGALLRAKMRFWNFIEIRGQVSYDNSFDWIGQGELALRIPFGPTLCRMPRRIACCDPFIALEERLIEQPDRFEILVTDSKTRSDVARHPLTGSPLTFFFVDNTSSSNGTFESPFSTLAQAEAAAGVGDAIYVFQGSGDAYSDPITLQDKQLLGGSAAPFGVQSRFGFLEIPAMTTNPPLLTEGITIGNFNRITGVEIATDFLGVSGDSVTHFEFSHNIASIFAFQGGQPILDIDTMKGTLLIHKNNFQTSGVPISLGTLSGKMIVTDNFIYSSNMSPIEISTAAGTLVVERNEIHSDGAIAIASGMSGKMLLCDNLIDSSSSGLSLQTFFNGTLVANRNTFSVGSDGIDISGAFSGSALFKENRIDSGSNGINLADFDGILDVFHNQITSNARGVSAQSLIGTATIEHNQITSTEEGIQILPNGVVVMEHNFVISDTSEGVTVDDPNGNLLLRNNTFQTADGAVNAGRVFNALTLDGIVQNNEFLAPASSAPGFSLTQLENSRLRFAKNTSDSSSTPDVELTNGGTTLKVESPNSALTGLEAINEGEIDTTGVTFVPFD